MRGRGIVCFILISTALRTAHEGRCSRNAFRPLSVTNVSCKRQISSSRDNISKFFEACVINHVGKKKQFQTTQASQNGELRSRHRSLIEIQTAQVRESIELA